MALVSNGVTIPNGDNNLNADGSKPLYVEVAVDGIYVSRVWTQLFPPVFTETPVVCSTTLVEQVSVSWAIPTEPLDPDTTVTEQSLLYTATGGSEVVLTTDTTMLVNVFEHTGLAGGSDGTYRLRAISSDGQTSYSNPTWGHSVALSEGSVTIDFNAASDPNGVLSEPNGTGVYTFTVPEGITSITYSIVAGGGGGGSGGGGSDGTSHDQGVGGHTDGKNYGNAGQASMNVLLSGLTASSTFIVTIGSGGGGGGGVGGNTAGIAGGDGIASSLTSIDGLSDVVVSGGAKGLGGARGEGLSGSRDGESGTKGEDGTALGSGGGVGGAAGTGGGLDESGGQGYAGQVAGAGGGGSGAGGGGGLFSNGDGSGTAGGGGAGACFISWTNL